MTNTYRVIIIDPMEHPLKDGEDQYDLYALWEKCKLPYGVWLEHWTVPDGQEWNTHPAKSAHELCKHECLLVEWDELQEPWNVKPKSWWRAKLNLLCMIETFQNRLEVMAQAQCQEVIEVLGLDGTDFDKYQQEHDKCIIDPALTGFIVNKVAVVITDIQGDEIVVDE